MSSYDVHKEISNLFKEATELNRKIGRLEAHIKHGTELPSIEPFDVHQFVERIALPGGACENAKN